MWANVYNLEWIHLLIRLICCFHIFSRWPQEKQIYCPLQLETSLEANVLLIYDAENKTRWDGCPSFDNVLSGSKAWKNWKHLVWIPQQPEEGQVIHQKSLCRWPARVELADDFTEVAVHVARCGSLGVLSDFGSRNFHTLDNNLDRNQLSSSMIWSWFSIPIPLLIQAVVFKLPAEALELIHVFLHQNSLRSIDSFHNGITRVYVIYQNHSCCNVMPQSWLTARASLVEYNILACT